MYHDVQLYNHDVREFLILARTWFAFGLPSKTRCDISGIKALLTVGLLTYTRMVALRTIDLYSHLDLWCHFKSWLSWPILCSSFIYILILQIFISLCFWFTCWSYSSILTLVLTMSFVDGPSRCIARKSVIPFLPLALRSAHCDAWWQVSLAT